MDFSNAAKVAVQAIKKTAAKTVTAASDRANPFTQNMFSTLTVDAQKPCAAYLSGVKVCPC